MPWRPLPDPGGEPPAPIAAPLDRVLRALGSPPAATLDDLFSSWSEVVGSAIGGVTTPLALDDGVLAVAVPDGGWASQIRWMERDLLVKFEDRFGPGVVTRIEPRVRAR